MRKTHYIAMVKTETVGLRVVVAAATKTTKTP
jgi:hypothetical protein